MLKKHYEPFRRPHKRSYTEPLAVAPKRRVNLKSSGGGN